MQRIKQYLIPHIIGLGLIFAGWIIPIIDTGMDRFSTKSIFTNTNIFGLVLILIGAYLPDIWIGIMEKRNK